MKKSATKGPQAGMMSKTQDCNSDPPFALSARKVREVELTSALTKQILDAYCNAEACNKGTGAKPGAGRLTPGAGRLNPAAYTAYNTWKQEANWKYTGHGGFHCGSYQNRGIHQFFKQAKDDMNGAREALKVVLRAYDLNLAKLPDDDDY